MEKKSFLVLTVIEIFDSPYDKKITRGKGAFSHNAMY